MTESSKVNNEKSLNSAMTPISKMEGKTVVIEGKTIGIGGKIPELKEGEKIVRVTQSVCPYCERLIPAIIVERNDKLYIRKVCPEHGEFEDLYYGSAKIYYRFLKYQEEGRGTNIYVPLSAPCPFNCGLCPMHKNHTALANIVVTNRCDLSCWYCFFFAEKAGYVYEPTIEQLREQVRALKKQKVTLAIQITGGEPLMRDDIVDIIKMFKEEGVRHIQLNTEAIPLAELYRKNPEEAIKWAKELREAGVNTIYMSFDGVSPKTNPKNHWDIPFIFDAFRKSGMTSVVLVPTVIKSVNDEDLGNIVKFAAENMDIVRGVNFQPVSLTGRMKQHEVEKFRITIPDLIRLLEEQTDGQIKSESWYPIPVAAKFARFIEAITGKEQFLMANHIACGAATYVIVERNNDGSFKRFHSITDFLDVDGFIEYLDEKKERIENSGKFMTYVQLAGMLMQIGKFIKQDKLPNGQSLKKLLYKIITERSYSALGEFHYSLLFLGTMHFMDQYNYDVQRVMRCNIHYTSPDGRVIPFCAYNVLNDIYRDPILRKNGMSLEEWNAKKWKHRYGISEKYVLSAKEIQEIKEHPLYKKTYSSFLK
ncbi:tetraether lipid synthase Tes [Fervidicoccus fontis]|uniref:Putative Fe-S osidoreductase n=1 Tax=Fervidicoccus fontis (strain DSM 19380 / JCM 18336 / VKM B-2539 / Kam940) TaxID=1163730 RepID=I0A1H6_FERFK|nr:radical SAM protein [Fervidicoccus fontis]AFH42833.1 putative Fe-S osidoreductase [Fervidicoccus fontis Kam940]